MLAHARQQAPRRADANEESGDGAIIVGPYRYRLWRTWDGAGPRVVWVLLNPSTADGQTDDPTLRRCVGYSRRWGYGGLEVVNLFAFRATDPRDLLKAADPIGPENDRYLAAAATGVAGIVVAWGERGGYLQRDRAVLALLALLARDTVVPLQHLGTTRNGSPRHPLRLANSTILRPYHPDQE